MSVETSSVPPWKLALLEKKRRQEDDIRRKQDTEGHRLSQMPAWKRDILLKKQQQKNSTVYVRKPVSPDKYNTEEDSRIQFTVRRGSSDNGRDVPNNEHFEPQEDDIHIVPIIRNPLVKKDPHFKGAKQTRVGGDRHSWQGPGSPPPPVATSTLKPQSGASSSASNSSWTGGDTTDGANNRHSATYAEDDVFSETAEEEVTYGRGFVHKLLQRFSHLSTTEKDVALTNNAGLATKRSSSSENILEGRLSPHSSFLGAVSPTRTCVSTENLLSPPLSFSHQSNHTEANNIDVLSISSGHSVEDAHNSSIASSEDVAEELPKPNTVRTARSMFESIASIPTSPESVSQAKPSFKVSNTTSKPAPQQVTTNGNHQHNHVNNDITPPKPSSPQGLYTNEEVKSPLKIELPPPINAQGDSKRIPVPDSPVGNSISNSSSGSSSSSPHVHSSIAEPLSPKHSFLYPAKSPSPERPSPERPPPERPPRSTNKETRLTNGTAPAPSESVTDSAAPKEDTAQKNHSGTFDKQPNKTDSKKPDHNRLSLNLPLDKTDNISSSSGNNKENNETENKVDFRNKLKKVKRPAPSGPGSMLIRPASNLVTGTKTEYLKLTSYTDVKKGEFAPAKKRVPLDNDYDDYDEVPVTNIDDVLDDVPVTDIDNVMTSADANQNPVKRRKYDFIGGNVSLSKNLLVKTRHGKRNKLQFHPETTMFEYPSEQELREMMPADPEPDPPARSSSQRQHLDSVSSDEGGDHPMGQAPSATLSGPNLSGVGNNSGGALSSYKSKFGMDYNLGMKAESSEDEEPPHPPQSPPSPADVSITPGDEDTTWSDVQSSDLLF